MEALQILIEKYWAGTATKEEKAKLLQVLSADEQQVKNWLEQLYKQDMASDTRSLSPEKSITLLQNIQALKEPLQQDVQQKGKVVTMRKRRLLWAVASVAIVILTVGVVQYYNGQQPGIQQTAALSPIVQQLQQVTNTGNKTMMVALPDGSVVSLQPKSSVSWKQPFDSTRRDIALTGQALFKVAKDASKPFTVYANTIATTALGTQFTVNTTQPDKVVVKLYEGKVVVRSVNSNTTMKKAYLVPGQQYTAALSLQQYTVKNFAVDDMPGNTAGYPTVTKQGMNELVFTKEPLQQVFKQLSAKYNTTIISNADEMKGLVFTGSFSATDNLQSILSVITGLNGLSVQQQHDSIIIQKEK